MSVNRFVILVCMAALLGACGTSSKLGSNKKQQLSGQDDIKIGEVTVLPKRTDNFRTTPLKQIDILHTDLSVEFNWGKHECMGNESIQLKPYFYAIDSIVLDARNMTFQQVQVFDSKNNEIRCEPVYDKRRMKLKLERRLAAGDTVWVKLRYTAHPDENEKGTGKAIRDDRGLYFINTDGSEPYKPVQLWTQGETEANSNWFPTIDQPNEKFTFTLHIRVPKHFTTLSNGELTQSETSGETRTDTWVNELPMPAYLVMMAISDFSITKDHWKQKEVSYYLEEDYRPYARRIFNNTVEMIDFYSERLGVPYPWHKYAQVVVRDYVSGAMENTSATLHGEFVQKNARELTESKNDGIISHELFHQWFGDLVTCESWSHLTLNEGFASYGEQLWIEHKEGRDAGLRKCYQTIERYIGYTKHNEDGPIINYNYRDPDEMFNTLTYQKGSRVLHLLRTELGDDAFFAGLKQYLTRYAYQNAEIDDLRREMEGVSGRDLRPFFQQWFLQGGHPVLDVRYDYNDTTHNLSVQVEQVQDASQGIFKFPLKFRVTQGKESRDFVFPIRRKKEVFHVERFNAGDHSYPNVVVDPEASVPAEIRDNKPFLSHIQTYRQARTYVEKVRSLLALSEQQKAYDTVRATVLSAITDADDDIRLRALRWVDWSNPLNFRTAKEVLTDMGENDTHAAVRAEALKILGSAKDPLLLNYFRERCADSSYTVAGTALAAIYKLLPDEAYHMAGKLQHDVRGELLIQVATLFGKLGDSGDLDFFRTNIMKFYKGQRAVLIEQYAALVNRLNEGTNMSEARDLMMERARLDQNGLVRAASIKGLHLFYTGLLAKQKGSSDPVLDPSGTEAATLKSQIDELVRNEKDADVLTALRLAGIK